jgi:hypothetical protein
MTINMNIPPQGDENIEPDVSLKDSPLRKKRSEHADIPMIDRMEVPSEASLGLTLGAAPEEEDEVYGNEEFANRTKGWQPRSRLSNSREMQFRSRSERVEYFKKSMDSQAFGKTYLPPELINDTENAYRWIRKTIRGRFDDDNIRTKERIGWLPALADQAPSFSFFSYDGEVNDSATIIEGGGLYVGKLDIELYCHYQGKYNRQIMNQGRWNNKFDNGHKNVLDVPTQAQTMMATPMTPQFQDPFKPTYQGQPSPQPNTPPQNPGGFSFEIPQYQRPI